MTTIGHVILSVSDWERSSAFYDALLLSLGFAINHEIGGEWGRGRSYKCGEHGIWIQHNADAKYGEFVRNPGLDHLCLKVSSRAEVDAAYTLVLGLGATVTISPKDFPEYAPGYYAFNFRDPDGLPLEVATY
jgi:glyoxylase I family protein